MKKTTKQRWEKFGFFCLTFTPLLVYAAIAILVSAGMSLFLAIRGMMEGTEDIFSYIMQGTLDNGMMAGAIYAILGIICLGLWYYFGCKRKKLAPPEGVLTPVNLLLLAAFAFVMQYVTNYLMIGIAVCMPKAMDTYEKLVQMAGLGKVTVMGVAYGVIIGPIAEEIVFRGVTLYYAQKFTKRFWLANILQAAAFGIMHMNLVQGLYAFLLGLAMGWVYHRFQSLYAGIWLHMFFNGMAYGPLTLFDSLLPKQPVFLVFWGILMCGAAVGLLMAIAQRTRKQ